jgi:anti-sigma factor RsiW
MNEEQQLELQAYLDGELSARKVRHIEGWLADDAEARALLNELRITKQALAGNESHASLLETREFYWSKIEREIKRQATAQPAPGSKQLGVWWKRILVPAMGAACLMVIVGVAIKQFGSNSGAAVGQHEVVASLTDSGAVTYRDDSTGVTLVWFSYPSEN